MNNKFLILFLAFNFSFSQTINDYKAVIVPMKFSFQKTENSYNLNTLALLNLKKAGFIAFFPTDKIATKYNERCKILSIDVIDDSGLFTTKLTIVLKDCYGKEIFRTTTGKSREKDFKTAYTESINKAFDDVYALKYQYNEQEKTTAINLSSTEEKLFAQPIDNGFQLIDKTPKVVIKIFKTTKDNFYIAIKDNNTGVLFLENQQWFFEYYQENRLVSEKINFEGFN